MTFNVQFMCVFMISLFTKCNMPNTSGSLVIAVKLKAKENVCMAIKLLSYILQKITLTRITYISMICYHTSIQDPILSDVNIAFLIQVHASAMLSILIVGNLKSMKLGWL